MYFSFRKPYLHSNAMSLIFIIPAEINSLKCKIFLYFINIDVDKDNVFHIPLFFNPKIESKGKILHFKEFISAGIIKIKDIVFECRI
jgi:hypothetical protein